MPGLLILAPPAALALGAVLTVLVARRGGTEPRRLSLAVAGLASVLALLPLAALARLPEGKLALTILDVPDSLLPAAAMEVDRMAAVGMLGIAALAWLACAARPRLTAGEAASSLAIASGASLLVAGYHTPVGLVYGWLALDAALFLSSAGDRRALVVSQVGLLMAAVAMAAATALQIPRAIPIYLPASTLSQTLLILAAALRMGLYPIWTALPLSPLGDVRALAVQRLAPSLAAIGLFLSATLRLSPGEGWTPPVLAFCGLAVLGGGLLSWLHDDRYAAHAWQMASQAGLVTLAGAFGGAIGAAMACILALDLVLSRAALGTIHGAPATYRERLARVLATASALGVPPTLGFAGRWLLSRQLLAAGHWPSLLVIMLGSALASASLLLDSPPTSTRRELPRLPATAAFLAAATTLVLGLWFRPLDMAMRALVAFSPVPALVDLVFTLRSPLTLASGMALLVAVLAPVAVAMPLARSRPVPVTQAAARFWQRLRELVALDWLGDALTRPVIAIGVGVQRAAGFASPRRAMAWTLLAVLVVSGWLILTGFPGPTSQPTSLPPWPTLAYLAVIAAVIGLIASASAPAITLAGLAASQLLSAVWLVMGGGRQATIPLIGVIYGLVGLLAVGILALSLSEAPPSATVRSTVRRFRVRHAPAGGGDQRGMVLIALAIVLVMICSADLPVSEELVPLFTLRPALLYAIGGALVVIFARTALQLVVGVLLAYIGFQMGYAQIDAGLLVTFGLSAFHLLFALVAAYYVAITMAIEQGGTA